MKKIAEKVSKVWNKELNGDVILNILFGAILIVALLAVSGAVQTGVSGIADSVISFIKTAINSAFGS